MSQKRKQVIGPVLVPSITHFSFNIKKREIVDIGMRVVYLDAIVGQLR